MAVRDAESAKTELRELFAEIDRNSNGRLCARELRWVFGEHAEQLLGFCDKDGDREISCDEWLAGILAHTVEMPQEEFDVCWIKRIQDCIATAEGMVEPTVRVVTHDSREFQDKAHVIVVADRDNHRVKVMQLTGGQCQSRNIGRSWMGAKNMTPYSLAMDGQGHLAVADSALNRVEVFRLEGATGGQDTHLRSIGSEGSGPGQFRSPHGVALDEHGNLVVADWANNRVQVFRVADGSHVRTIGGSGSGPGQFKCPEGVAVDEQGNLLVADRYNHRIQVLRLEDGSHVRTIGCLGSYPHNGPGQLKRPCGVASDGLGNVVVADSGNNRVQVFRLEDGSHVRTFGGSGSGPGKFFSPQSVTVDGESLLVGDKGNDRVQVLLLEDGSHLRSIGLMEKVYMYEANWNGTKGSGPLQFDCPMAVAVYK